MTLLLSVVVLSAVAAQSYCFHLITTPLKVNQAAISGGLGLVNSAVQLHHSLMSDVLQDTSDIAKKLVQVDREMKTKPIQGVADITNQAIGVAVNMTREIPILSEAVSGASGLATAGVNALNLMSQAIINKGAEIVDSGLSGSSSVGQAGISAISNGYGSVLNKMAAENDKFYTTLINAVPGGERASVGMKTIGFIN